MIPLAFTFSVSLLLGPVVPLQAAPHSITHRANVALAVLQTPDGKAIYARNCKQCHGALGNPPKTAIRQYKNIATFTHAAFFTAHPHKELIEAVTNGKGDMLASKDKLTTAEIEAVVTYIHTLAK